MNLLIFDLDDTLFDSSGQNPSKDNLEIETFLGTFEVLSLKDFTYALVTRGDPELQHAKIDCLKVRKYFHEIYICPTDKEKKNYFKMILEKLKPLKIIVIGNRIDCEIRYGKEFKAITIHYRHGKYLSLKPKDHYEIPDHSVENMTELSNLLLKI